MKLSILLPLLTIEFFGPCETSPLLTQTINPMAAKNVGVVTISTLEKNKIPYKGNESALSTAFETPVGMDALEVISDTEMRAYGWCYEVDGKIAEVFADKYKLNDSIKKITWFYGFAHYKNGEWISQCELTSKLKPEFLCGKSH